MTQNSEIKMHDRGCKMHVTGYRISIYIKQLKNTYTRCRYIYTIQDTCRI